MKPPAPERRLAPNSHPYSRPRDSRRESLYEAERLAGPARRLDSLEEAIELVGRIEKSDWFVERFPGWRPLELRGSKRSRRAWADIEGRTIVLPTETDWWTLDTVLHEFAHFTQARGTPWHGHTFGRVYLELLYEFGGRDYADRLAAAMRERNIDITQGIPAGWVQP